MSPGLLPASPAAVSGGSAAAAPPASQIPGAYSTVTDLARLRGMSTLQPRMTAMW